MTVLTDLKNKAELLLTDNILNYWMNRMVDHEHGGFYGQINGNDILQPQAAKGAVLNARILWTFAAAYRVLKDEVYLQMANRAKQFLLQYFYDTKYGGIYWSLDYKGKPLETKKQIYASAFAIYGLSEYVRATDDAESLQIAQQLYEDIERHSLDQQRNGYLEAFSADWSPIADMRLSSKDDNVSKTMNTHLHILEAYTNLYRVWRDDRLAAGISNLISLFKDKFYVPHIGSLILFFDDNWQATRHIRSFGHEIEASWIIHDAVLVLDNPRLTDTIVPMVQDIALASLSGYASGCGLAYEYDMDTRQLDGDRHWWVQAETVVGWLHYYLHFGDGAALERVIDTWNFIFDHLCDRMHGEWYWSVSPDLHVNHQGDKAGFWKCPYHNGRMCLAFKNE